MHHLIYNSTDQDYRTTKTTRLRRKQEMGKAGEELDEGQASVSAHLQRPVRGAKVVSAVGCQT